MLEDIVSIFVLTCSTGDVYEGSYESNKKHGKGIFIQADGTRYEGIAAPGIIMQTFLLSRFITTRFYYHPS